MVIFSVLTIAQFLGTLLGRSFVMHLVLTTTIGGSLKILVPQLLHPRYGTIHHVIPGVGNLTQSVARLIGCDPIDSFEPHWIGAFDHQYSIIAVRSEEVIGYAQFDFREFNPSEGRYGGDISCLASRGMTEDEQRQFFASVLEKYKDLTSRLAQTHPELIDHPLAMPWIFLRHGQRSWAKLLKRCGWNPCETPADYTETPGGRKLTVYYKPPRQYIAS